MSESDLPEESTTPSLAAVAEFLRESGALPDPGDHTRRVELPNSVLDVLEKATPPPPPEEAQPSDTPEEKPPVDIPVNPIYSDDLPTVAKSLEWTREFAQLGQVTVTPAERNMYLKAALNDTPVIFPVSLLKGQAVVTVKSGTPWEMEIIHAAARMDQAEQRIDATFPALASRVQLYSVILQVTRFNAEHYDTPKFSIDLPISQAVEQIRRVLADQIPKRSWPKWNLLIVGLRKFEHKLKICHDNLANENFWFPEDAG